MELFNVGPLELVFILAIAIAVMGPAQATELAGQLGRLLANLRRNVNMVRSELSLRLEEETKPLREVQTMLQETGKAIDEAVQDRDGAQPPAPPAPAPRQAPSAGPGQATEQEGP